MNVVALVPRRADGGQRDRVWAWVRDRWAREHPNIEVIEGHHDDGPFNRSVAINSAARATDWDVAVICDADSFVPAGQLDQAVKLAAAEPRLVHAYERYCRISEEQTARLLAGEDSEHDLVLVEEILGSCSGCVAVNRDLWARSFGFDERCKGWGWEDVLFALRCQMFGGPDVIVDGIMWHLWHPRGGEIDDMDNNRRYLNEYHKHIKRGPLRFAAYIRRISK